MMNLFTMYPKMEPGLADAGNPERAIRDRVLDRFEISNGQVLDQLRARLRLLYKDRRAKQGDLAFVTADDARIIIATDPAFEPVRGGNMNFLGHLFRGKTQGRHDWVKTGQVIKSRTPGSHANELKCWRPAESIRCVAKPATPN